MTRTEQIANAVKTICIDVPFEGQTSSRFGIYVEDHRFDIRIERSGWGAHVWDQVTINGNSCGNRCGGVHYLMIALGESEPMYEFADRHAIAEREKIVAAEVAMAERHEALKNDYKYIAACVANGEEPAA